ncbi:hypothetical protein GOODEAATRI_022658, partial [Goodea atripinnis]
ENNQAAPDEENQVPVMTRAVAPVLSDPLTDKKPPVDPASVRASSSLEKTSTRPVAQCHPEELKTAQPENIVATPCPDPPSNREVPTGPSGSALQRNRADLVEDLTPFSAGMKSRLQMLAEQRKYWDGDDDAVPDSTPLTLLKKQVDVQPPTTPPPSEAPVGRRGRLANLAATIGSWEDDLSHAHIPKEKPGTASVPKFAVKAASVAVSSKQSAAMSSSTAANKSASNRNQVDAPPFTLFSTVNLKQHLVTLRSVKESLFELEISGFLPIRTRASTSSPMRPVGQTVEKLSEETLEVIQEKEMNVDQSINSAVINELFDEVLEQSEDEEEEEDALNISSMSLLTPLAETVAAVVKSPERRLMVRIILHLFQIQTALLNYLHHCFPQTSTPASSFLVKSNSPENRSSPSKFQQANVARTASSSDSVDISDEDHKLPYR